MKPRINRRFRDAHPGDFFISKQPYHALVLVANYLKAEGYTYRLEPHPRGYMVHCTNSPHDLKATEIH